MYVYNLPYQERKKLCRILDLNNAWEQLGGVFMNYDVTTLEYFRQAPSRYHSPTDVMLTSWGIHNHTVLELFIILSKMQHYQAMMVLKPLVEEKYHRLIYEGEENFSRIIEQYKVDEMVNDTPLFQKKVDNIIEANGNFNFNHNDQNKSNNQNYQKERKSDKILIDFGEELQSLAQPRKVDDESLLSEGGPSISYVELAQATGNWDPKNILGKGGFGTVYKGFWKNTEVAIKRLEIQRGDDKQSLTELKWLNSHRHDNILPLYGYSIGGPHDCLVYQYMPKGSLEDRILCRDNSEPLTWSQRHSIATGTARGLQYLHIIGVKPLIHGDIKSANILLDPYLVPKIGDFGLAREGPLQHYTHVKVSRVHGTRPYLPDEFLRAKKFSTKVDTFSFGVVLFELATGLRAYDDTRTHKYLKDHVEASDNFEELRDSKAGYDEFNSFTILISIGRLCVSTRSKDRPEMVEVLQQLDVNIPDFQSVQRMSPILKTPPKQPDGNLYMMNASKIKSRQSSPNPPVHSPLKYLSTVDSSVIEDSSAIEDSCVVEENIDAPVISIHPPSSPSLSQGTTTDVCADLHLPLISVLGLSTEKENEVCSNSTND